MKVIVAGSRTITDKHIVFRSVMYSRFFDLTSLIVSGTAKGVDQIGEEMGKLYEISIKQFPADWDKLGKGAGFARNVQMADYADALIAIWNGKSKGTRHMIDCMLDRGKPVEVFIVADTAIQD